MLHNMKNMKMFRVIQMRMLFMQVVFVLTVKHLSSFLLNVEKGY